MTRLRAVAAQPPSARNQITTTPWSTLMSNEPVTMLSITALRPHPRNPRSRKIYAKSHPKMAELISSITAANGPWTPLIVRTHPSENGNFEILAGHRRYHACQHAKHTTIPCVVRSYSDQDAIALLLADNPAHEDIDPFEEARVLRLLLEDQQQTHDQIAAFYGRPISWVHRRARLARLTEEALAYIEQTFPKWSASHMELIARYEADHQLEILNDLNWEARDCTTQDLDRILRTSHRDIAKALWDVDDKDLVPKAGACSGCSKRTSCNQVLFPDLVTKVSKGTPAGVADECLDAGCWNAKADAQLARREAELAQKHKGLLRISINYHGHDKTVIFRDQYERSKKSVDGSKPAMVVDGPSAGSLVWIVAKKSGGGRASPKALTASATTTEPTTEDLHQELAAKRQNLERRRTIEMFRHISLALEAIKPSDDRDLSAFSMGSSLDSSLEDDEPVYQDDDDDVSDNDTESANPTVDEADAGEAMNQVELKLVTQVPNLAGLIAWVYVHGSRSGCGGYRWGASRLKTGDLVNALAHDDQKDHLRDLLWESTWPIMRDEVRRAIAGRDAECQTPFTVAALIGIDINLIKEHVLKAITEPKAWAKQYAAILPKAA